MSDHTESEYWKMNRVRNNPRPSRRAPRAFSLLELMAVIVVIGIIATLIIYRIAPATDFAKTQSCFHNRSEINAAIERWYIDKNTWPATDLSDLAADTSYFPSGITSCPVTGSAYTLNAITKRVEGHSSDSVPGDH